jgi:hypothetical protein
MTSPLNTISDRNLETTTVLSLKREPSCFAFLCARATLPPQGIDTINLDLASVDFYNGRASLWATLDMRSGVPDEGAVSLLGFDETFLRPFTRALIEAAATRTPYRMTIMPSADEPARHRVVEYITGPGVPLCELVITPQDSVLVITGRSVDDDEETLFQLPRTDSFLRIFVKTAAQADKALRDTLAESERIARETTRPAAHSGSRGSSPA